MFSRKKVVPKYELVEPSVLELENYSLEGGEWMRLKALRSFGNVKKGDFGGYIKNTFLSQSGLSWIEKECKVENSFIGDNAVIKGESTVSGAILKDNALIDSSNVSALGTSKMIISLRDNSKIMYCNNINVMDSLEMYDNASISNINFMNIDYCEISGDSEITIK